jgi:hypothetical protein
MFHDNGFSNKQPRCRIGKELAFPIDLAIP